MWVKTFQLCLCHQHRGTGKALIVYSLLQELARRDGLAIALSGRSEDELYPLLKYLSVNMTKPRYAPLLLAICDMVAGEGNSSNPEFTHVLN